MCQRVVHSNMKLHSLCTHRYADGGGVDFTFLLNYPFNVNVFLSPQTDAVFLILYKELYYRHIYAKVSVSNCSIQTDFNVLLHF